MLGKDRILCHCSPGHQLFNFIISTYDRYFFPPLETWELIGEPTIFASGHLEMEQKISRRFKEHIWKGARWHYPNLLMDSWSNPTPRVFGVINSETIPGSYEICAEALIKAKQSMP